jgi:hypothetical protein
MTNCENAQTKLTEHGRNGVRNDATLRKHVQGCEPCTKFLNALERVDRTLAELSNIKAPSELIDSVLTGVKNNKSSSRQTRHGDSSRAWSTGLGCAAAVLAAIGLTSNGMPPPSHKARTPRPTPQVFTKFLNP